MTQFAYNGVGELTTLTDPKSNVTTWSYDVEGRLSSKEYAESSTVTGGEQKAFQPNPK